jgi:photosynthetic reaction center H subunit
MCITEYYDFALISVWLFFIFFFFLIVYLRREDKREGYPLASDRSAQITVQGWPAMPPPKFYKHAHAARGPVKLPDAIAVEIASVSPDIQRSGPEQPNPENEP